MNYIKPLTLVVSITLFLFSCGSDDSCLTDDWVGTWSGMSICDDGSTDSAIVVVTKKDENTIVFESSGEEFEVTVMGCSFSISESIETIFGPVAIDLKCSIDGNSMNLNTVATILGQNVDCDINLTR